MGSHAILPICSILPRIYRTAQNLFDKSKKRDLDLKAIMDYSHNCIPLAKWTVNNLVGSRRRHKEDFADKGLNLHQREIYKVEDLEKYQEEFFAAVKEADDNFQFPKPKTQIADHINIDDKAYLLWQQVFKVFKMIEKLPDKQKTEFEAGINLAIDCSYRICKKLKEYNDKYPENYFIDPPDILP